MLSENNFIERVGIDLFGITESIKALMIFLKFLHQGKEKILNLKERKSKI